MKSKESLEQIIQYGGVKQKVVAIEELSELQKEIAKDLRGLPCNILEELADVEIMCEQLKLIYNIDTNELDKMKDYKIERTLERIENEKQILCKKHLQTIN